MIDDCTDLVLDLFSEFIRNLVLSFQHGLKLGNSRLKVLRGIFVISLFLSFVFGRLLQTAWMNG